MKKAKLIVLIGALALLGGCAAGTLTNLTKEGVDVIDTAIKDVKDSEVLALDSWKKNNSFVMAALKDVIEGTLDTLEMRDLTRYTEIANKAGRTDDEIGEANLIRRGMYWKGVRGIIRIFAPELLLMLP